MYKTDSFIFYIIFCLYANQIAPYVHIRPYKGRRRLYCSMCSLVDCDIMRGKGKNIGDKRYNPFNSRRKSYLGGDSDKREEAQQN